MKRLVMLFLAVLLAVSAVLTSALLLSGTQEQVTHGETVLAGDPTAADGLKLSLCYYGSREHPRWVTEYSFGNPDSSETDFCFRTVIPVRSYPDTEYRGVVLNTFGDYFNADHLSDILRLETQSGSDKVFPGLLGAYQQLYNETPEGELTNTYLRIRDYCQYYPLAGRMEFDSGGYHWNVYSSASHYALGTESARAFNEYFRIPVLEDDWIQVVVDKRKSGSTMESVDVSNSRKGSDVFRTSSVGVCFEGTAYFTFSALTEQGNLVDTSLIPGGYGLYGYQYTEQGGRDANSLTTLCSLDPSYAPYDMTVDKENRNLLYFSVKDGNRYLTVISLDTMEILQTVRILENLKDGWQFHKLLDNSLVAVSESAGVSVWEKDGRGLFQYRLTAAMGGEEKAAYLYDGAYAFDGQRLAVVQRKEEQTETGYKQFCGFRVSVYTGEGHVYWGEYISSLETLTEWPHSYCSLEQINVSWE